MRAKSTIRGSRKPKRVGINKNINAMKSLKKCCSKKRWLHSEEVAVVVEAVVNLMSAVVYIFQDNGPDVIQLKVKS